MARTSQAAATTTSCESGMRSTGTKRGIRSGTPSRAHRHPCQSGSWKKATGSGTGVSGILAPLKGKTITCTFASGWMHTVWAQVDANGNPFARAYTAYPTPYDSGWVAGFTAINAFGLEATWTVGNYPSLTVTGTLSGGCSANWPLI